MNGNAINQVSSGSAELDEKIREWLAWDRNTKTFEEVSMLMQKKKFDELEKMMMQRLSFGTAGLRGKMGPGYNAMNDLVIVQTGQGILNYLERLDHAHLKQSGIVIGFDGRHNSKRFAELTATIFLNKDYPVRLFTIVVPTPFVPFTVTKYKCILGIMITASHNPKEDNGYKVYASNGAQITSPADQNIQEHILDNLEPWESSWNVSIIEKSDKRINPLPEVLKSYLDIIGKDLVPEHKEINLKCNLKFVYTPLHGVGFVYFARAMDAAGLKIIPVEKQKYVDASFPTVKFPNPEEGKSALDMAIATADANKCVIVIANDPDADRMASAEKNPNTGEWKIFNGNEMGALMGWWALHCFIAKHQHDSLTDVFMLGSTVSSKILKTMAKVDGFNYIETLTGFKWMGNKTYELIQEKKRVLFAFEEAIGFMWGTAVLDKDGISAGVHFATMVAYLYHHGMTVIEQLNEIYQEYGYHITLNSYFVCTDPIIKENIFVRIQNFEGENQYPKSLSKGKYVVKHVRDLATGYDNFQTGNKAILPTLQDAQMITFEFTNGVIASIRTSGTEPKIKYYTELCAKPKQGSRDELEQILVDTVHAIVEELLQPKKNKLIPKSD